MGFDKKAIAVVPAAGSGARMGLPHSKLLCKIAGESVLARTLNIISSSALFDKIIVPCRDEDRAIFSAEAEALATPVEFITGGSSRQQSVKFALDVIRQNYDKSQDLFVLVHDAARCFVSIDLLKRCLESAYKYKAVTAALECVDTIYSRGPDNSISLPLLERAQLRAIQTPQAFSFDLLWNAHLSASELASDDSGLVAGIHSVKFIDGETSNFKVTNFEDLQRADYWLRTQADK